MPTITEEEAVTQAGSTATEIQVRAELRLVNPDPKYPQAKLIEPTTLGYIYVAAAVRPPGRFPFVLPSRRRSRLLVQLKKLAHQLGRSDEVVRATVFRAIVMPPTGRFSSYLKQRGASIHLANFDVAVLIQATSPAAARRVQTTPAYDALMQALRSQAKTVRTIVARNARRIGDVDTSRKGLFLFNHFAADDVGIMLQLWDYLAGWYAVETGLDNSVAMRPLDGETSDYAIVNWARWDTSPLRHFWSQLSKKSFRGYVLENLEANRAASMPIYHRLA
ncbi:MAG TPA: hypothetical protein VGX68_23220 [Thermoanaerobaculia bacterium]|jgi:hypothetical protein|nr:hypothetical protein [Thermoanaerobaculia bacterium]